MNKFIFLVCLIAFFSCTERENKKEQDASEIIHNRPSPVLPAIASPRKEENVFSINLSAQMHATLFKVNYNNTYPYLVEKFDVSKDQLNYSFTLKKWKFHNGIEITADHVKRSLESVVRLRSPGFERFNNIIGYEEFLKNGDNFLGIDVKTEKIFTIRLSKATPDLLVTLSDLRNVILFDEDNPAIGAGQFRIVNHSDKEILLKNDFFQDDQVKFLRYYQTEMLEAIGDFKRSKADDLFLFPIGKKELEGIGKGNISTTNPPRTYVFAINARMRSKEERFWIYEKLPDFSHLSQCYPDGLEAYSLAPKGRMGFLKQKEVEQIKSPKKHPKGKFRVSISKGVGNEECVRKLIQSSLKEISDLSVTVDEGKNMVEKWANNTYDVAFFYLELDNSIDEYQFFTPASSINFGVEKDEFFRKKLISYYDEQDVLKRNQMAKSLNQDILNYKTIKPVFYPKQHLIYSDRYEKVSFSDRQDADMSVSSFRLKKG